MEHKRYMMLQFNTITTVNDDKKHKPEEKSGA